MATFKKGDKVKVVNEHLARYLESINLPTIGVIEKISNGTNYLVVVLNTTKLIDIMHDCLELIPEVVNDFNTQSEVWEYLLTGGKVVSNVSGRVYSLVNGRVHTDGKLSIAAFENHANFKKCIEPKWYENIPATGILCWVSDVDAVPVAYKNIANMVVGYDVNDSYRPFATTGSRWRFATPVTPEEAARFILQQAPTYKVGDYFTVVEKRNSTDRSYRGDCFEVKVVEGNLVRAKRLKDSICGLITLDTNDWILKPVSDTYAKSFK